MGKGHNLNEGIFFLCESCGDNSLHAIEFVAEEAGEGVLKGMEPYSRRCLTCGRETMFQTLRERVQALRKSTLTGRMAQLPGDRAS